MYSPKIRAGIRSLLSSHSERARRNVHSLSETTPEPLGLGQEVRLCRPRCDPVVYVQSGETITFDCLDASNGQITPTSTALTISSLVFSQLDQVSGPVHIEGALPGDTLQVDVLKIETANWGWTGIIPGFGLLHDEFSEPALKIWELDTNGGFAWFDREKGIKIPLRPFPGEMGVAPGKDGAFSTIPPYSTGGNLDTKYLRAGSTLYLPIEAEGGLFSIGDGHAAQGDGGTAIETPMQVTVRLTVRKDKPYTKTPHYTTTESAIQEEYYCTTGIDANIETATKAAVRYMIDYLVAEHQLERTEAYMLCSVAGDLKLHEVVDMPNYVVGMMLPKSIFTLAA
ncbi:Formamidase [Pleurotus eryngii]|uniref:Formamidase n=1 Tax=Pleurotus eryngii TaxID=5323 RepID=A0A9P5ZXL9_PLEER|nr:Formamidase [Pleurotus eryngii]